MDSYHDWNERRARYQKYISAKRSLQMQARMNDVWHFKKGATDRAEAARAALADLAEVPRPGPQPLGFEVIHPEDGFQGFYNSQDLARIERECQALQELGDIPAGQLQFRPKPRWSDEVVFRYAD